MRSDRERIKQTMIMLKDSLTIKERKGSRKVTLNQHGSQNSNHNRASAMTSYGRARSSIKSSLGMTDAGAEDEQSSQ